MTTDHLSADAAAQRHLLASHGSARVADLYAAGLSKDQIAHRIRVGTFVRHAHGVVGLAGARDTPHARAMRGVLIAGDGAAACLWTAAELHGLDAPREQVVHVLREGPLRRAEHAEVVLHRTRRLPADHVEHVERVPTTTVDRTLVDCARLLDPWQALRMLDSVHAGQRQWDVIHRTATRMSNGRAGVRALADATATDGAERFRSMLERRMAELLARRAIAGATWNVVISDADGRIREVDLCFRRARLIVELDGLRFHAGAAAAARDRAGDRRLALAGWRVLRFTWRDVVLRPESVAAEIAAALAMP